MIRTFIQAMVNAVELLRIQSTSTNQFRILFFFPIVADAKFVEKAQFESSQRGSCVLIYEGKRFTRDGKFTETTNWRCCYFRDKCRARAITRYINRRQSVSKWT